jgi:hypothetical protein
LADLSDKFLELFPATLVIITLTSGIVLLLLSPFRLVVPSWVSNPFEIGTPQDTLSSFAVIIFCSFALGIPFYLATKLIVGNYGLNHLVRLGFKKAVFRIKRIRKSSNATNVTESSEPQKDKELPAKFYKWIKDNNYSEFYHALVVKNAIINGLLIGFEIALIMNFVQLFWRFSMFNVWLLILSVVSVVLLWVYNRWDWRPELKKNRDDLIKEFEKE